ncbi:MAG: methionyl-tRNA formyltransferase [Pyrinomonadaceae bacterium]
MRIVFMGTPASAVPSLRRCLDDGHEVVAVWTQPDRVAGRGQESVKELPVKQFALDHQLEVEQPKKLRIEQARDLLASYEADVAVVVAYGRLLPPEFLRAPRLGCINVHFSLLPKYRGAAPVNWAIVNGEEKTGVTTMFIEKELDSGPILLQRETQIGAEETAPQLIARLADMGADLLSETLSQLNAITPRTQHSEEATLAPLLRKEDGLIDWSMDAFAIERRVRGFQPWPNAYTFSNSRRLIVWRAAAENLEGISEAESQGNAKLPSTIIAATAGDLVLACGHQTVLHLLEVQPEGARRMTGAEFLNGARLKPGKKME